MRIFNKGQIWKLQKKGGNADTKQRHNPNDTDAGGLQQVRQPAYNTPQIYHIQVLDEEENKWKRKKN